METPKKEKNTMISDKKNLNTSGRRLMFQLHLRIKQTEWVHCADMHGVSPCTDHGQSGIRCRHQLSWDYSFKNEKKRKCSSKINTNKRSEDTYEDVCSAQKLNEFERQPYLSGLL
jgi:hypothetical protein